jgi:hypothetical protein
MFYSPKKKKRDKDKELSKRNEPNYPRENKIVASWTRKKRNSQYNKGTTTMDGNKKQCFNEGAF